ncbi:hypothetical protein C0989_010032 [Termitomyces sp. Mn162]|nr:hypothetical protein C0989_010032 [Termitomyces sp. Mn162]
MVGKSDVETGEAYARDSYDGQERQSLLPSTSGAPVGSPTKKFGVLHLGLAFLAGVIACAVAHLFACPGCFVHGRTNYSNSTTDNRVKVFAPPYVGSTQVHNYPPSSPTNANPTLFPSDVGYPGGTPTGAEPNVIETAPAYPIHTGAAQLVVPNTLGDTDKEKSASGDFNLFQKWGNLSPWYSVGRGAFGLDSDPTVPETCRVTASYGGPASLAARLNEAAAEWNASGSLEFLNDWYVPLFFVEVMVLTAVEGHTNSEKSNFTETNTIPVFRTESQDRMLHSALNFAIGFFGYPLDGKYQQSITIESDGVNNTLSPYTTCSNANVREKGDRGVWYVKRWAAIYLVEALARLQPYIKGYELSIEDVYVMQQMCAYETVAIGYSKFCELFTEDEWEGFNYAYNRTEPDQLCYVWPASLYPHPHQPFLRSLQTRTIRHQYPIPTYVPSLTPHISHCDRTNTTPHNHTVLECTSVPGPQLRIIINDGVTPLTGIKGCPEQRDGMCPVDTFVKAQKELLLETDWEYDCFGNWTVPEGDAWNTTIGSPPKP